MTKTLSERIAELKDCASLGNIFKIIVIFVVFYLITSKANIALAIVIVAVLSIDYHIYLRGGKAVFFADENEMEKDLREIQKLETKKRLKFLKEPD